ncbi:MAG: M28 family peptidase, partial [Candidatus Kariarchaeaceae archaeon]
EEEMKDVFLVTSHYDGVMGTPGAADNGSAVAIMLETARLVKDLPISKKLKFFSFTLEENNPSRQLNALKIGLKHGLLEKNYKPTTYKFMEKQELFLMKLLSIRAQGSDNIFQDTVDVLKEKLSEGEIEYFTELYGPFKTVQENYFSFALLGSTYYLEHHEPDETIIGALNYDPIGYTDKRMRSQKIPPAIDTNLVQKHNTSEDLSVGDFVGIFTDVNSQDLGRIFMEGVKNEFIDLPAAWIHAPLDFQTISKMMPDILRSDHAGFWKRGIPAVFISDTANFRNPNYHKPGDTFDSLDYEFMQKVCQSTIAFLYSLLSQN